MAVSDCFRAFLLALTTPIRAQLRQLLFSSKILIEIQLSQYAALAGRQDLTKYGYKAVMDQIETVIEPIEDTLALIPWASFNYCPEVASVLGNVENAYFDKKFELEDLAFKYAQLTFLSTHTENLREELQLQIDKLDELIAYIDNLIVNTILPGVRVRVYSSGELGTVQSKIDSQVTVALDIGGTVEVGAGDVGEVNA